MLCPPHCNLQAHRAVTRVSLCAVVTVTIAALPVVDVVDADMLTLVLRPLQETVPHGRRRLSPCTR